MEQAEVFMESYSYYLDLDTIDTEDKRTNGMDLMDQDFLLQFISSLMAHEKWRPRDLDQRAARD